MGSRCDAVVKDSGRTRQDCSGAGVPSCWVSGKIVWPASGLKGTLMRVLAWSAGGFLVGLLEYECERVRLLHCF